MKTDLAIDRFEERPEVKNLLDRAQRVVKKAFQYNSIRTDAEFTASGEILKEQRGAVKDLDTRRRDITRPIDDWKKEIMEHFGRPIQQLTAAAEHLTALRDNYKEQKEQERIRAEQKLRLQMARDRQKELDKAEKLAEKLKKAGDLEGAALAIEQAEIMAPETIPAVNIAPPDEKGIFDKTYYRAEVTNLMELIKAVAEGKVEIEALSANQSFLDAEARSHKDAFAVPGVKLIKYKTEIVRR